MDNITMDTVPEQSTAQTSIMNVEIKDENVALNIMVSFLNIAQKRGAFNLEESARIWECVQKFIITPPTPPTNA
jgi:hypothetical protein